MNNRDFEGPPFSWSLLSTVGGLATAIALILGLELSADRFRAYIYTPSETVPAPSATANKQP